VKEIFNNKRIVLGVTGSIAAYKSPLIVRELIKLGAHINVVMTPASTKFVSPLALQTVSKNPVAIEKFDDSLQSGGAWHVELANWADAMLIAPCSAATLAKLAIGLSDNALVCVAMALPKNKPLVISPAMDFDMWLNKATQRNVELLKSFGYIVIPPQDGELASGLTGPGRLPDIPILIDNLAKVLDNNSNNSNTISYQTNQQKIFDPCKKPLENIDESIEKDKWNAELELQRLKEKMSGNLPNKLNGKKVLITAGPTIEKIDDVRYISNYSTGKMGYACAEAARYAGAEVILISGPVALQQPDCVTLVNVTSAKQMFDETIRLFEQTDIAILAAAVADFVPINVLSGKLKKENIGDELTIKLKRTNDILAELGKVKKSSQLLVGFALESENEIDNGKKKLLSKNCDMIVVNSVNKPDSGFGGDFNTITIIDNEFRIVDYMPMSKQNAAISIINYIVDLIKK